MADEIRCPMCGKPNPSELDVCQFCGARLKPLLAGSSSQPEEASLRPGETPIPKKNSDMEPALPDWLHSLRQGEIQEPSGEGEAEDESAFSSEEAGEPEPDSRPDAGSADWLANLREGGEEAPSGLEAEEPDLGWLSPAGSSTPENIPDWLADMRSDSAMDVSGEESEPEEPEPSPSSEEGDPDWLRRIRERQKSEQETGQDSPAGEAAGFSISDLSQESGDLDLFEETSGSSAEFTEEPPGAGPIGELPDWLSEGAPQGPEGESAQPAEDLPDWLAELGASAEPVDQEAEPEEEPAQPAENAPDWLAESGESAEPVDQEAEPEEEPAQPAEDVPVWLAELGKSAEPIDQEAEPKEETVQPAGEVPDWQAESGESAEPVDQAAESEEESAQPAEDVPDWLAELGKPAGPAGQEQEAEPADRPAQEAGPESGEPVEMFDQGVYEAETMPLPDWLSSLGESSQLSEDEIAELVSGQDSDELPADLEASESQVPSAESDQESEAVEPAAEPSAENIAPFTEDEMDDSLFAGELPEWLSSLPSQEGEKEVEESEPAAKDSGLEPVNLPGWLEAMRPVEAAAPEPPVQDETFKQVVGTGPLAGLRGILPAEVGAAHLKKSAGYSVKLQVSDNQQAHAAMLEEMVKSEGLSRPLPGRPVLSSQYLLRVLIFIVLVAAILWPVITGSQSVALPSFSQETFDASNLINKLQVGEPVLLAVDYTPGLSGELDAASGAVLDHLMVRGAYLALVSTNPTGPAQAERLLQQVNARYDHQYLDQGQYADLGYIPGGSSGLLGFVEAPQQVLPFTLDGARAWEIGSLGTVKQLADFKMVIVISDTPENAQAWIEQVQPSLGNTPLLMVVSAQAEPMIRPYYEGQPKQVQGIVSGLAGGASYEGLMVRNGLARKYWDAFSMGIVVAAMLIILGGVFNAASALISSRKQAEGEGKP